jgi:hypothetical protein
LSCASIRSAGASCHEQLDTVLISDEAATHPSFLGLDDDTAILVILPSVLLAFISRIPHIFRSYRPRFENLFFSCHRFIWARCHSTSDFGTLCADPELSAWWSVGTEVPSDAPTSTLLMGSMFRVLLCVLLDNHHTIIRRLLALNTASTPIFNRASTLQFFEIAGLSFV